MTVSCDYMGGSSQGIGKPFASALLVRAPWPSPFSGTARRHRTSGRSRPFVSWLTARVHEEPLLCSVRCRHSSYQKHLHWIMQSGAAGAADRAAHVSALVPERGREDRFGECLTGGLSLALAKLELSEESCAILGFALALLFKLGPVSTCVSSGFLKNSHR